MKKFFSVIAVIISLTGIAQKKGYQFYIAPQVALLNGAQSTDAQVQLVAGVQNEKWAWGIGTGFDYYVLRSVPLFADAKRFINIKNKTVFAYANAGMNIVWPTNKEKQGNLNSIGIGAGASNSSFGNGWYADMGIGILLGKKKNIITSIGYSNKRFTETYKEWSVILPFPPVATQTDRTLNYSLNRIVIRAGIKL